MVLDKLEGRNQHTTVIHHVHVLDAPSRQTFSRENLIIRNGLEASPYSFSFWGFSLI